MTAALRSYETNSTVLSRSQNCCSVSEADFSCGDRLFQHVGLDTAKLRGPYGLAVLVRGLEDHYEPLIVKVKGPYT